MNRFFLNFHFAKLWNDFMVSLKSRSIFITKENNFQALSKEFKTFFIVLFVKSAAS